MTKIRKMKIKRTCKTCEKKFWVYPSVVKKGKGKFCSKKCFSEYQKTLTGEKCYNWKGGKIERICKSCGKVFYISSCCIKYGEGKHCSIKCANISKIGVKRIPFTREHKDLIGKANKENGRWGEDSNNWQGGITPLYNILRSLDEYKEWRMNCLKRDWFKCQNCGSKIKLEVHHIKSFQKLVAEFLQEYDQFSPFEDRETLTRLAFKWQPFWDMSNGITYCYKCHKSLKRMANV